MPGAEAQNKKSGGGVEAGDQFQIKAQSQCCQVVISKKHQINS